MWYLYLSRIRRRNYGKFSSVFQDGSCDEEGQTLLFELCEYSGLLLNPSYIKQNASFVMLTRNGELEDVIKTINSIEEHFNQWFHYPYVFLNDQPFEEDFKAKVRDVTVGALVEFGTIDEISWNFPSDVKDTFEFYNAIEDQGDRSILYGNLESYHKMCRFYSGLFYKHPLVQKYEWYWRLEPDVEFFCDITYDPFLEMLRTNKKYGFTIIIPELYWTVPNLFRHTKSFISQKALRLGHYGNYLQRITTFLNPMIRSYGTGSTMIFRPRLRYPKR
ncbi:Glycolipid 2-alpha-mannosyltransferase family protein [Saccharomyces cerevisiae]|nr:Glycolipid 2-alpha-mannosyltransferase family protein [Saccharomyces cerevisiae]